MQARRIRLLVAPLLLVSGFSLSFALRTNADKVMPIPVEVPSRNKPANVKTYMKMKELGAHKILGGLIHRDFEAIKKGAESLKWVSLDSPKRKSHDEMHNKIYEHFRLEFTRSAGKLEQMAEDKNLDGAAYAYQNLTATCIACHEHLRDSKNREKHGK